MVEDRRLVKAIRYEDAKGYMQQLLRGLHFLHSNWILHRYVFDCFSTFYLCVYFYCTWNERLSVHFVRGNEHLSMRVGLRLHPSDVLPSALCDEPASVNYSHLDPRPFLFLLPNYNSDLKPDNLLLTAKGVLKIADFGLARYFGNPNETLSPGFQVITRQYRPPELLLGSRLYGPAVDIWSVGCIMVRLCLVCLLVWMEVERVFARVARLLDLFLFDSYPRPRLGIMHCPHAYQRVLSYPSLAHYF